MVNVKAERSQRDRCSHDTAKTKKMYGEERFCAVCYVRVFKKRLCPGCGNPARLPRFDPLAICSKCISSLPCRRCNRTGRPVGRMTLKGPVCNSCAHYFTVPKHCEVCDALSTRLTNKEMNGQVRRCCPRCANTSTATCPSCRRNRVLVKSANGTMQCKRCSELGEVPCKTCEQSMPAGLGIECMDCYWRRTFHKRLAMNTEGFSSEFYRQEFNAFGYWLIGEVTAKEAALLINKHMVFFVDMAARWSGLPCYEQLLGAFGADWIRRAKYPVRWMAEHRSLIIDRELKKTLTERRRIDAIFAAIPLGPASEILSKYYDYLKDRTAGREASLSTIRGALRSAANLLACSPKPGELPSSSNLRKLLVSSPGTAASLSGFVTYLNQTHNLSIEFPEKKVTQKLRSKIVEQSIIALAQDARAGKDVMELWVPTALHHFHNVSRFSKRKATIAKDGDGFLVTIGTVEYWIPSPSIALASF